MVLSVIWGSCRSVSSFVRQPLSQCPPNVASITHSPTHPGPRFSIRNHPTLNKTSLSFHIASLNTQSLRLDIHKRSVNTKQTAISQNGSLGYVRNGYKTVIGKPEGTTWETWAYKKRSFPFAQHEDACECGRIDPLFLNRGKYSIHQGQ